MFRLLASLANPVGVNMANLHPVVIDALLERCWSLQLNDTTQSLGDPRRRSDVPGRPAHLIDAVLGTNPVASLANPAVTIPVGALDTALRNTAVSGAGARIGLRWQHLIYAYMIENTRIMEIFRRVVDLALHGERLGPMDPIAQRWLWTTEELFFRDPPSFSTVTQTSWVRPRPDAYRGNLYHRFFGVTLNTSANGDKSAFQVAEHANGDFINALDELLHEVWQGRSNFANAVGARPTDDAKIAELSIRLSDMLRARRTNGALSREEFNAVCTMSWFHVAIADQQHPIVTALKAEASSPEERLFKIAQRVGHPAHGLAKSYFEIAEPLSRVLIAIEEDRFKQVAAVPALYNPNVAGGLAADTDLIKTHWSIIRGRDVKAKKVYATA